MTLEANAPATRRILTAAIVLPMTPDNPVLQDGAVLVEGDRIAAVGSRDDMKSLAPEAELLDYGQAIPAFCAAPPKTSRCGTGCACLSTRCTAC